MNKSTTLRSEEARRQAQATLLHAKQQQDAMLKERAMTFASETQKVENLRAQRLARIASGEIIDQKPAPAARPARTSASIAVRGRNRSTEQGTAHAR